ncbi:hypothetical protein D9M70_572240 [compost metagenome]
MRRTHRARPGSARQYSSQNFAEQGAISRNLPLTSMNTPKYEHDLQSLIGISVYKNHHDSSSWVRHDGPHADLRSSRQACFTQYNWRPEVNVIVATTTSAVLPDPPRPRITLCGSAYAYRRIQRRRSSSISSKESSGGIRGFLPKSGSLLQAF